MSFLCPVRVKRDKRKGVTRARLPIGRITGSSSLDTLVHVEAAKESGTDVRMVVIQDFEPCVNDEMRVRRGQEVKVLYQENDWLYVITAAGKEGFVPYNYCLPFERSIDDFAELLKKKDADKQVEAPKSDSEESSFSLSKRFGVRRRGPTKSVPDIAQHCGKCDAENVLYTSNRSSQRKSIIVDKSIPCRPETPKIQEWDELPREMTRDHRRSMLIVAANSDQHIHAKPRSHSLDRNDYRYTNVRYRQKSGRVPILKNTQRKPEVQTGQVTQNDETFQKNYSSHIYVNDSIRGIVHVEDNRKQNKPDILPVSVDNVEATSNRGLSGSSWRNVSTRSAPTFHNHSSGLDNLAPSSQRYGAKSGYSTAQVMCDFYKPSNSNPEPNASVFMKSNKGNYVVLYDFNSLDEGDLYVKRGELVTVLNTDDPEWCWVMNNVNEEGFVPASFVSLADDPGKALPTAGVKVLKTSTPTTCYNHSRSASFPASLQTSTFNTTSLNQTPSSPASHSDPTTHLDLSTCTRLVCLYNYVAQSDKDLSVTRGDWLFANFDNQRNTSWLWVFSQKSNKSGYVPRSYVKTPNFGYQGPSCDSSLGDVSNVRAIMPMSHSTLDPFLSP